MSYVSFHGHCVLFGCQTSKNVHDVRKVFLRMYSCVLMCLSEFYAFVLFELSVGCSYDLDEHFLGSIVRVRPHQVPTRGARDGPNTA